MMRIRRTPELSQFGAAAVDYASEGLRVLPCLPGAKKPRLRGWPERATTEIEWIRAWWRVHPDDNIGLLTGAPGYDVLDIDVRDGGNGLGVAQLLAREGVLAGAVGLVATPSGGRHIYFPGTRQRKSTLPGQFVDFQATGGYVVAPPSRVTTRGTTASYRWLERAGSGQPLAWSTVLALAGPPSARASSLRPGRRPTNLEAQVRAAPVGQRNGRLFYAANRVVESGGDPYLLLPSALDAGLSRQEAEATIRSAIRTSGGRHRHAH